MWTAAGFVLLTLTCPHDQNHHDDDDLSRPELSVLTHFFHGHFVCEKYSHAISGVSNIEFILKNERRFCSTFALRGLCFSFFGGFELQLVHWGTRPAYTDGLNMHYIVRICLQIPQCNSSVW